MQIIMKNIFPKLRISANFFNTYQGPYLALKPNKWLLWKMSGSMSISTGLSPPRSTGPTTHDPQPSTQQSIDPQTPSTRNLHSPPRPHGPATHDPQPSTHHFINPRTPRPAIYITIIIPPPSTFQ